MILKASKQCAHQERFRDVRSARRLITSGSPNTAAWEAADIRRLPDREAEHPRSKQVYADQIAENGAPKDLSPGSN